MRVKKTVNDAESNICPALQLSPPPSPAPSLSLQIAVAVAGADADISHRAMISRRRRQNIRRALCSRMYRRKLKFKANT
jgi:hypothetical protein